MRVTFTELAERELNDASQYYEGQQPGLGTVRAGLFESRPAIYGSYFAQVPLSIFSDFTFTL